MDKAEKTKRARQIGRMPIEALVEAEKSDLQALAEEGNTVASQFTRNLSVGGVTDMQAEKEQAK